MDGGDRNAGQRLPYDQEQYLVLAVGNTLGSAVWLRVLGEQALLQHGLADSVLFADELHRMVRLASMGTDEKR